MKPTYFYGWNLVAFSIAASMVVVGVGQASFGLYVLPVSKEFGLSRADMNTVVILGSLGGAVIAPFLGWMADRFPPRPLVAIGSGIMAISFATLGLSHSILLSAAVVAFVLHLGEGLATRPIAVRVVRWFNANRGRALTISAMGLSLGGIVVVPCVGLLLQNFDWRTSLMISGAVATAAIFVPGMLLRLYPTSDEVAREKRPDAAQDVAELAERTTPLAIRTILTMPLFWCVGLAIAIPMSVSGAIVISLAPMAMQAGIPVAYAATFATMAGVMAFSGKIGLAIIADKANQMLLLTGVFFVGALENAVLFLVSSHVTYPAMLFCAALQGISSGALMPLLTVLIAKKFGPASFGTVFGVMFPLILVMTAASARFIGEVFDRTGSYRMAFALFVFLQIFSSALIFLANRLRAPNIDEPSVAQVAVQPGI